MNQMLFEIASNPRFLLQLLLVVAALATVVTVVTQRLGGNALEERMKAVAIERERLRGSLFELRTAWHRQTRGQRIARIRDPISQLQTTAFIHRNRRLPAP